MMSENLFLLIANGIKVVQESFNGFRDIIINGTEKIYNLI